MTQPGAAPPTVPDHELLHRIGEGSYGEVWLARNATGTLRAVKIVHRDRFSDDRPYEREFDGLKHFEPVSRTHEGFVDILQIGRNDAAGFFYYVMELADDAAEVKRSDVPDSGLQHSDTPTLHHSDHPHSYRPLTLETRIRGNGRLPVQDCMAIGNVLAEALGHLHQNGLVHRDIKPSNIIFVGGVPKLADVGLVARADSARTFVGTEGFIPPEGPGTPQADIYSLGKCLYEMAMGKDRQAFPSPPTMLDDFADRAELLELNQVIARACDPLAARRYRTTAELATDLAIVQAGESVMAARRRRKRKRVALVCGVLAATVAGGWLGNRLLKRPSLEVVREFSLPGNWPAFSARLGRFESQTNSALFAVSGGNLAAVSLEGVALAQQRFSAGLNSDSFDLHLLADADGNGRDEVFVAWRNDTNACLSVFNQWLVEVQRFETVGNLMPGAIGRRPSSTLRPLEFVPARASEPPSLLAAMETTYALEPRAIRLYNYTNRALLWEAPFPAMANRALAVTPTETSPALFVIGTQSHANGAKSADGLDDYHSYLYALSAEGNGNRLWIMTNGPQYVTTTPILGTAHGTNLLLASIWRGYELSLHASLKYPTNHWQPAILKFDHAGGELARFSTHLPLGPITLADLEGRGVPQILVPCGDGSLLALDENLKLLRQVRVVAKEFDWVNLRIAAVQDLDADGRREIVLGVSQLEFVSGTNPGRTDGEANVRRLHGNSVIVLDHHLRSLARHAIHAGESHASFEVLVTPPEAIGGPAILVLDQKVTVLRFKRR